jgi:hypothetical protein
MTGHGVIFRVFGVVGEVRFSSAGATTMDERRWINRFHKLETT